MVQFTGQDVDLLLGNKAELLLALEQVTMEALRMPSEDHSRICFDANDYRMLRIEELRMSAPAAAERVKNTGAPFFFNPMNSRERRVIHLALRDETGIAQRERRFRQPPAGGCLSGGNAERSSTAATSASAPRIGDGGRDRDRDQTLRPRPLRGLRAEAPRR